MRVYALLRRVHALIHVLQTDDILPFRTSLTAEYALLLAAAPLGLGLAEDEVRRIAASGMQTRFTSM
jgi:adenosine deaminase